MARVYAVTFSGVTGTAAQDLFEITPADDVPIEIVSCHLAQTSDVGDSAEEMLRIKIIRGHTTSGSGGASVTPIILAPTGSAASFSAERNNTTIASAGSPVDLHADAFNIRAGWIYMPPPDARPRASQANTTIVVRLMQAPADALTLSGTLIVREL